jgi:peptide/nickel transport system substrate-binding protein
MEALSDYPAAVAHRSFTGGDGRGTGYADTEFEIISLDADRQKNAFEVVAAQMRGAGLKVKRTVLPGSPFWKDWTKYPFSVTEGGRARWASRSWQRCRRSCRTREF